MSLLALLYICFISYFAFISKLAGRTKGHVNQYNLKPFTTIQGYLVLDSFSQMLQFTINILGNIIVFMPVGIFTLVFLNIRKKKNGFIVGAIVGLVFCMCVEVTQYILSVGIFDVDDLILNTLGAIVGVFFYYKVLKIIEKRGGRYNV